MATFPALEPDGLSWQLPAFPLSIQPWPAGEVRFRHGATPVAAVLSLSYDLIPAADADAIRSHYHGQRGGLLSFPLPPAIWTGHTTAAPATITAWRYSSPPEEDHHSGGLCSLSVTLEGLA